MVLEPLARAEEQWRGVGATPHVKGNLGLHALRPGLPELIERTRIRGREQGSRGRQVSGLELELCGGERPRRPLARVWRERHRSLQERSGGGGAAAALRTARG